MKNPNILAIDDDKTFLETLKKVLNSNNYKVDIHNSGIDLTENQIKNADVVLLDIYMPGMNGIEVLKEITIINPQLPVIIISGRSNIKIAVEAMKLGAYDFIEKPVDLQRLNSIIKNAVSNKQLKETTSRLIGEISENYRMIGNSDELKKIFSDIQILADTSAKVLITGESGTGKELVAWALHYHSSRKEKPFIRTNCAAIPKDLLESELFGYKKGAFTGAINGKLGKFEAADGGTLFLDEIGEMDFNLQAKLLRVLEEEEIEVIGETETKKIDVKIISATNQNLMKKVEEKTFREDLYHRLNVCRINIPPLRERPDDIIPLANFFINKFCDVYNKQISSLTTKAAAFLLSNKWKGNIRELRNLIENVVLFSMEKKIDIDDIIEGYKRSGHVTNLVMNNVENDLHTAKENFEREYLITSLNKNNWKIIETAAELGIDRTNLFKKIKKHRIKK